MAYLISLAYNSFYLRSYMYNVYVHLYAQFSKKLYVQSTMYIV